MSVLAASLVRPEELSPRDIGAWREITAQDRALGSPYFSPDYSLAVASVRRDIEIALWRQGRELRAILPFHRRAFATGIAVGGSLNDYQALIAAPGVSLDAEAVLAGCRLGAYDYRYWLSERVPTGAHWRETGLARYLDLSQGYQAYFDERREAGVQELQKTLKKRRKLEREVGPIRFVAESDDPRVMAAMKRWKTEQYRRTNHFEALSLSWIDQVVDAVFHRRGELFRGALSALYAGDTLVATHFGMRTDRVWHYWFPTHSADFAQYSPGMILALCVAEHAASIGVERIDLGKGDTRFKTSLGTDAFSVDGGYLGSRAPSAQFRHARFLIERSCEKLPIGSVGTWPRRLFNRIELDLERRYRAQG
jgi:CelD/BcsL family acetyltransferase involved in cellulose biosynthesis